MTQNFRAPVLLLGLALVAMVPSPALAWSAEGHRIVALIADHYLEPAAKTRVDAMLAADTDPLTQHDIASESLWADAAGTPVTKSWHVMAVDLRHPDFDAACGGHPALPKGTPAARGPAACSLDKIDQFIAELSSDATAAPEKLLALKYLLNLVADLHEPLYVSDDHNDGGEASRVVGGGADPASLRHYWDSDFLDFLGDDPKAVADDLADGIRQSKTFAAMSAGAPRDWSREAFAVARDHAYGKLPPKKADGGYELPPDYVTDAIEAMRLQLARAGVRLAAVLNRALTPKN